MSYQVGAAIEPLTPSYSGGEIKSFIISPDLPAGLRLDPHTGVISGTPSTISPQTSYTVIGKNDAGIATTKLILEIIQSEPAPANLRYSSPSPVYLTGQAITPNTPTYSGGEIRQFSVAPTLPAGLTLDSITGVINGTPSNPTPSAKYTVTGSNSAGSISATITIAIEDQLLPPVNFQYSNASPTYSAGVAIEPNRPTWSGGTPEIFSISPTLPAGLSIDIRTGVISGTPTNVQTTTGYTVFASNAAGSASTNISIAVDYSPTDLSAAVFPDINNNGWLVTDTAIGGVKVHIAPYKNIKIGDQVKMTWQAYSTINASPDSDISGTGYQAQLTVNESQLSNGLDFLVPYQPYIEPIATTAKYGQGSGKTYYTVLHNGQPYISPDSVVPIDLGSSIPPQ
nr:Ig domain-containing protein [Burkholderia ubonensis]